MSRTDKDRPYWVIENEGTLTDHRHERFGQPITAYTYARDENGKRIKIIEPMFRPAYAIIMSKNYPHSKYSPAMIAEAEKYTTAPPAVIASKNWNVYLEMRRAYQPDKLIYIGDRTYYKREVKVVGYVKDYCTEGEKVKDGKYWFHQDLPCTPDLPKTAPNRQRYTRGLSKARSGYSKARNGANRVTARDTLKGAAKAYNAGFEVDDFDERTNLTAQHRHSMTWDLY
jgi:hypothetical protein